MGEVKGFLKYKRQEFGHRPVEQRIRDFAELDLPLTPEQIYQQTARCMDCGVPFCHGTGCPLRNCIPDLNELVYQGKWQSACELLHSTNNFPEITGRVCPAPCEAACTLSINDEPVLIRHIEFQIVERGFKEGWIKPLHAEQKSGKKVAVIGSGPAGLAAAQQLARAGHSVIVFEKDEKIGGLLRYGIPNFKLAKTIIDRRLKQLTAEGVEFQTGVNVGEDISARYLRKLFDCICLTMGASQPRDLNIAGRGYENILFAVDYLKPPEIRPPDTPWPMWPRIMRTSTSHEEGCNRQWSVSTRKFSGVETRVTRLHCCGVEWLQKDGAWNLRELPGTEFTLDVDMVLLAMGFLHVTHNGLVKELELKLDRMGNVAVENCQTSQPEVFAAGDTVNGASLVVQAIDSGRQAAAAIDNWLKKQV